MSAQGTNIRHGNPDNGEALQEIDPLRTVAALQFSSKGVLDSQFSVLHPSTARCSPYDCW
jgi:hypothetical protein